MRIAFFTETFLPATDGVVTRLRYTIEELAKMGDDMLVVAPRYPDGGPDSYAGAPIYRVPGVPFPPYPRIKLSFAHPGVGRALAFRAGPDPRGQPLYSGSGRIYYARRLEVPLVASYHTNVAAYARYNLNFSYNAARWWTRQLHNRAEINLCTSAATMDYLLKEGVKRIRLWPQGWTPGASARIRPPRYGARGSPTDTLRTDFCSTSAASRLRRASSGSRRS